jgi:peptide/nickel transport system permease protein
VIFFARKGEYMSHPEKSEILKGTYRIEMRAVSFDADADVDLKIVLYGRVYGLAGTDSRRRDLLIGILWGAPVALAFGLVAALSITFIQTILGVISGYYGGRVDEFIQRVAEFLMIIPFLPILIMISFLYKLSLKMLLMAIVLLSIAGSTTKTIRSMVPQIKEEQYILAARSYGATSRRIIFKHIFPRVIPYTLSIIALGVPTWIFVEAALSFLGLGDPILPTWGKMLGEAHRAGAAYHGYWWWVLIPASCIGITAMAFALLGYAFDKIVNPRLREM